ncbi:MAG: accessory factor UbiK family protein [Mariprofundaceae bacterium]
MSVNNEVLDDIAEKIAGGLRMFGGVKQEAESQVRSVVEGALEHFDVVTHERMQVQEAMLSKAREELATLDARVKELEEKLKGHK